MSIEIIQSRQDFLALKEDWNHLLSISASHVPFLRHEFLFTWWETLGGGEWDQGSLAIAVDRDKDGSLGAIAPFFINRGRVMFLGSHEISDYLDLIAPSDRLSPFISDLFSYLREGDFPDWQMMDLYNLPEDSLSLPLFKEEASRAGYTINLHVIQPAPYLTLPGNWQEYLSSIKERYRREIEKKIGNAENYFLPVSWYIVEEEESLADELDAFLSLMAKNPQKEVFLSEKMIEHIKLMAWEGFREGWLQLAFLQVGDIKAAGYLNFDFNNQLWVYNSGIDPLFENLSPGWVLLGKIINWAIENKRVGLDFMRGNEVYKYQFGGVDKNVLRLEIKK